MVDYLEKALTGKSWRRSCRIIIENPLGEVPSISYIREDITQTAEGDSYHKLVDSISYKFEDPEKLITMIDMGTNRPTGTKYSAGLAAWILYSLFWELSQEKDKVAAEEPTIAKDSIGPTAENTSEPIADQSTPNTAKGFM